MEPWTEAQRAFAVKAFYKMVTVLWSLGVNFEESSEFVAIVLFHHPCYQDLGSKLRVYWFYTKEEKW